MNNNYLVMMVKRPTCGAVKSRLAADIGAVAATSVYRTMMYNSITRLAYDPRWRFVLSVAPDAAINEKLWPRNIPIVAQGGGGLGERMHRIMAEMPPGKTIIIGSDVSGMRPVHMARAFRKLGQADAVFSPSDDGGYSLVGLKRCPRVPAIFGNVRWSSPHTLQDTLRNLEGYHTGFIEELRDIDTGADWKNWKRRGGAGRLCF